MATYYTYYYRSKSNTPNSGGDWRYYFTVDITTNSSANSSTLTIKHYVQFKNQPSGATSRRWIAGNSLNGGSYSTSSVVEYAPAAGSSTKLIYTQTRTVTHDSDGTKTITLQMRGGYRQFITGGDYDAYMYSSKQTITLPTINRSSSITEETTISNPKDFGETLTFVITRPSNETHTLKYSVGGTEYTIATGVATSYTYAFPLSLVNYFPNNSNPTIVVYCYSSNGTTCSTNVRLKVPDSYVPTCALTISDVGDVPSSWGIWLKAKSKISGTITAEGIASSAISSYTSNANGSTYTSSTFTTDYLKNTGSQTITTTVKDSRNRTKSDSKTINVVDYWTPTLSSFSVVRCDANGAEKDDGTYGKVKCNYSIAPCENNNTKSLIVKYGDVSKTFTLSTYSGSVEATSSELFSGLSTASNHAFEFYLIDYFNPNGIKYGFTMTPAFTTISYFNGGKGVTIGQVATEEGFHSYMDSNFHSGLKKNDVDVPIAQNSKTTSETDTYSCNYINGLGNLKFTQQTYQRGASNQGISAATVNALYFDTVKNSNNEILTLSNGEIKVSGRVKFFIITIALKFTAVGFYSYIGYDNILANLDGVSRSNSKYWSQTVAYVGLGVDATIPLQVYSESYMEFVHDNYWSNVIVTAVYE